ncbi:hypothetical protein HD806DRAFT_544961 [Xylariaceae sp. AK1471]|nr:hypothetical protein HD806DRAFT_544961 [Xylariaceae sp. AK1471]
MLDVTQWYALALGAGIAVLTLRRLLIVFNSFITPRMRVFLLKHIFYPLLVQGRSWLSMTRFHAVLVSLYASANITVLFLFLRDATETQHRSAVLAVANLSPLFFVGHTNTLSDWLGLSTAVHLLGHRTIGVVAIFHAFVHTAIALKMQLHFSYVTYSGLVAAGALLCILIISLVRLRIRVNHWVHELLGLTVLGGLLWHFVLLSSPSLVTKTAVVAAPAFCLLSAILRICKVLLFRSTVRVTEIYFDDTKAANFIVSTKKPMDIPPGKYFYVFMAGSSRLRFHSYPLMAIPSSLATLQEDSEVMFCATNPPSSIRGLKVRQKLWLDGPYGPDLHLETYENLVLVAQGIGILGVLPIAIYIARRKWQDAQRIEAAARFDALKAELQEAETERSKEEQNYRLRDQVYWAQLKDKIADLHHKLQAGSSSREPCFRDLTRRITILWLLDNNSQERWVGKQIQLLQEIDPANPAETQGLKMTYVLK